MYVTVGIYRGTSKPSSWTQHATTFRANSMGETAHTPFGATNGNIETLSPYHKRISNDQTLVQEIQQNDGSLD